MLMNQKPPQDERVSDIDSKASQIKIIENFACTVNFQKLICNLLLQYLKVPEPSSSTIFRFSRNSI